jgi:hypothetical protein
LASVSAKHPLNSQNDGLFQQAGQGYTLETAVDRTPEQIKPSIDADLRPILATVQQCQNGDLNNFQKLLSDRNIQSTCRVSCNF